MMTRSIRSYKSLHGTFASISPQMMRSKSVRNLMNSDKTYDLNESPTQIEIKINNNDTILSNRVLTEKRLKKIEYIDTNDSNISSLYKIEQKRHNHTKTIQYNPHKLGISTNKNYMHPQIINDNFILSKLSKEKMYYKSIQSNMVSPKGIKNTNRKRRGSMEIISNQSKCYVMPTKSECEISAEKTSNVSENNISN